MSEQQREEQVVQENGMYATSSGISLMEAKLMNYFNVGRDDYESMDKINRLSEYFTSIDDLRIMDLRLGQDPAMSRLDKIYLQVSLMREHREAEERKNLIEKRLIENSL